MNEVASTDAAYDGGGGSSDVAPGAVAFAVESAAATAGGRLGVVYVCVCVCVCVYWLCGGGLSIDGKYASTTQMPGLEPLASRALSHASIGCGMRRLSFCNFEAPMCDLDHHAACRRVKLVSN